ncbi:MAG: TrkH family potassium uptake protein [Candidatus Ornithomonoglobus sp.]
MLPVSLNDGESLGFLNALFTSTSAVCVTGLVTVDTGDTFSVFGKIIICLLIQTGGLGVATVGVMIILAARGRMGMREMSFIREAFNISGYAELKTLFKRILCITFGIEAAGAVCGFFVFIRDFPFLKAAGISIFHAVSSFNNAGFDVFGGGRSLTPYSGDAPLNIITMLLIILGGIGFLVMTDVFEKRRFKKLRLSTKAALVTTAVLIAGGTLLLKLTLDITWLGALFQSVSTRTAGFASFDFAGFTPAGLFVCIILMVIGASPGSTGGGIKTTTAFTMFCVIKSTARNRHITAFRRRLPDDAIRRAFVIFILAIGIICFVTLFLSVSDPQNTFIQNFFEAVSAYGTVGLSTGITSSLSVPGRIIIILTMFSGRVGALTIATLWGFNAPQAARYTEEHIAIG